MSVKFIERFLSSFLALYFPSCHMGFHSVKWKKKVEGLYSSLCFQSIHQDFSLHFSINMIFQARISCCFSSSVRDGKYKKFSEEETRDGARQKKIEKKENCVLSPFNDQFPLCGNFNLCYSFFLHYFLSLSHSLLLCRRYLVFLWENSEQHP